jgi:hypothetical protein
VPAHVVASASASTSTPSATTPVLAWKQPVLGLEVQFGHEQREEVELVGTRAQDAQLSITDASDAGLDVTVAHGGEGDRLDIHAPGHPVGTRIGVIKVATGLPEPAKLALPFSYTVHGTLAVDPSNPFFDLLAANGSNLELRVASTQPDFRLQAVDVIEGPFQASFLGSPGGAYRVAVKFVAARANGEQRGTLGHLRLRSNDRSEPEKVVPLMAFGRAYPATASH